MQSKAPSKTSSWIESFNAHKLNHNFSNFLDEFTFVELISNLRTISSSNAHFIYPKDKLLWWKSVMLRLCFPMKINITHFSPLSHYYTPYILIFVNDLKNFTNLLDPVMFADGTNLFYMKKKMLKLKFETVNNELQYVSDWFRGNKLSLNEGKIKFVFFHKQQLCDSIPL